MEKLARIFEKLMTVVMGTVCLLLMGYFLMESSFEDVDTRYNTLIEALRIEGQTR